MSGIGLRARRTISIVLAASFAMSGLLMPAFAEQPAWYVDRGIISERLISATSVVAESTHYRRLRELRVTLTGYSSTPDQTDTTPFLTAANTSVRDGVIAANFLPFGTKVKIPEYSGNKVYTVEDRMHERYPLAVDIWRPSREEALAIGRKPVVIVILTTAQ